MKPIIEISLANSLVLDWGKLKDFFGSVAMTSAMVNSEIIHYPMPRHIQLSDYREPRKLAEPLAIAYMNAFLNTVEKNPVAAVEFLENLNHQRRISEQKINSRFYTHKRREQTITERNYGRAIVVSVAIKSSANIISGLLATILLSPAGGLAFGLLQGGAYFAIDSFYANKKNNYNKTSRINTIVITGVGVSTAGVDVLYSVTAENLWLAAIKQQNAKLINDLLRKLPTIYNSDLAIAAGKAAKIGRYSRYIGRGVQAFAIGLDINDFVKAYKSYNEEYGEPLKTSSEID